MPPPHRRFQWWHKRSLTSGSQPSRPAAGESYSGRVSWSTDPLIGRPGFYGEGGELLTWVDEAPTNEEDGSGHYEVANPDEPYYTHTPTHLRDPNYVALEAQARGATEVNVNGG